MVPSCVIGAEVLNHECNLHKSEGHIHYAYNNYHQESLHMRLELFRIGRRKGGFIDLW